MSAFPFTTVDPSRSTIVVLPDYPYKQSVLCHFIINGNLEE